MNTDYTKKMLKITSSPHIKSPENTGSVMLDVIIALLPATAWGVYVFGVRALVIILLSVITAILSEALYQIFNNIPVSIKDGSAFVTGLLLALCLPVSVPLWMPVVGAVFAIIIVKQLFGGIGKNIVNPAISARVFLYLAWPQYMTAYTQPYTKLPLSIKLAEIDALSSATPLTSLNGGNAPKFSVFDTVLGNVGGSIGEVSAVLLIVGGLYLLLRKTIKWYIPVSYVGTVAVLAFIFPQTGAVSTFVSYQVFGGGLLLGAIFMATDYTTSPITKRGKLIYGVGCGLVTVAIRYFGQYPEGVSFAIMIMNLLVWYLDMYTRPSTFGGAKKI